MIERECKWCGKPMTFRTQTDARSYCSRQCFRLHRQKVYEKEDDAEVVMPPLTDLTDEAAKDISAAILNQIVDEYQHQLRKLKRHRHDKAAIARIFDLRDEIMHPYFSVISLGMDGEAMIREIEADFNRKWTATQRLMQRTAQKGDERNV